MERSVKVAIARASTRGAAVAEALALIGEDVRRVVKPQVLIKPNLVSHQRQLPSTHVDTLTATLDAVLAAGAREITVAEGASDATAGFERFGFRNACRTLPVCFFDINRDESRWDTLSLQSVDGSSRSARVSQTIVHAPCRVSLALAKTHVTSVVTLSLKNMLSSLHPHDRVMMHGYEGGGNGYQGWKRLVVEFLKGDNLLVEWLTRSMGRVKNLKSAWIDFRLAGHDAFAALRPKQRAFLKSVDAMNRNLVALARATRPHLSVVDGFVAMHREGPRHGTPIKMGTVIAGTDPVAVDAVATAVMGFDPRRIGYLVYADLAGIGIADLDAIEVVGEPIAGVRRMCVPHSNIHIQRHWDRLQHRSALRGPHFSLATRRAHGSHER
ncbi:MAG: DUF362 domain-containing protein [Isosphaeraceae bacterium]